jgi:hypothetical protein
MRAYWWNPFSSHLCFGGGEWHSKTKKEKWLQSRKPSPQPSPKGRGGQTVPLLSTGLIQKLALRFCFSKTFIL